MVAIKDVKWIHFSTKDNKAVCERCGQRHDVNGMLPLPVDCMLDLLRVLQKSHRYCEEKKGGEAQKDREVRHEERG